MGASLTCVSCLEREDADMGVTSIKRPGVMEEDKVDMKTPRVAKEDATAKAVPSQSPSKDDALQQQINARLAKSKSKNLDKEGEELQGTINRVLSARKQKAAEEVCMSPSSCAKTGDELQDQINAIVKAHATSLKEQRVSYGDFATPSPSPVRNFSHDEIAHYANLVLADAKERQTPQPTSLSFDTTHAHWAAYEEETVAPCKLDFADSAPAKKESRPKLSVETSAEELDVSCKKGEESKPAFSIADIPSPTRARAKQQKTLEEVAVEPAAAAIEEDEDQTALQTALAEAAMVREIERQAEMSYQDQMCIQTFLESVKRVAGRNNVRTPIKGTNLYTKFMRPCRPAGTSVDVKDSSFHNLGAFLKFLESEGLLKLQPGLSDPVVSEIDFAACKRYRYAGYIARQNAAHCLPATGYAAGTWQ